MIRVILLVKVTFMKMVHRNCLVSQPLNKNFKVIANTDYVSSWKSKRLSAETIKPPTTSEKTVPKRE